MISYKDRDSLKRQLGNLRDNLRLINDRISEFVEPSQVPLQLKREKQETEARIADIEAQLAALCTISKKTPRWLILSVTSFLVLGIFLFLFFRPFQCIFVYRLLDDALVSWIVLLLGSVTAAVSILDPKWKSSYKVVDLGISVVPGVAVVLVIVMIASKLVLPLSESECFKSSPTPFSTEVVPSPTVFNYQVRVQAEDTGDYVQNAKVTIEVGTKAPLDSITDSNGLARIFISYSYAGQPGRLIVEATGYVRYEQYIDLTEDALPDVVQLEPKP